MNNVISFSLFGNNPIYTIGCIKNAELHKTILRDWEMRVYHDDSVNQDILKRLLDLGVNLVNTNLNISYGRLWRFLPASESNVDYFISRDSDSRISLRDEAAINEWFESKKKFNIIREHPIGHCWVMNAGMWGCKGGSVKNILDLMMNYKNYMGQTTFDQHFLREVIYPIAKESVIVHDEFCNLDDSAKKIERDRFLDDYAFIGESIDEFDNPRGDQRTVIRCKYGH